MSIKIKSIWDNDGETIDRYTIVTDLKEGTSFNGDTVCLGLSFSPNANSPQGVSMFCSCVEGSHLGKKIRLEDLSIELQDHITRRLK